MTKIVLATAAAFALSTSALFAQTEAVPDFVTMDTDASGEISWEELAAAWPEVTAEQFTALDADANGSLSTEEYAVLSTPTQ